MRLLLTRKGWVGVHQDEALARPEAGVFVQRCAKVVFNYCLTLTYNAGRQRRRMVHAMEDWGQVSLSPLSLAFGNAGGGVGKVGWGSRDVEGGGGVEKWWGVRRRRRGERGV
eukprot:2870718-Rhodomonas_salina.4